MNLNLICIIKYSEHGMNMLEERKKIVQHILARSSF